MYVLISINEVLRPLSTLMAVGNTGDLRLIVVSNKVHVKFAPFGLEEPKRVRPSNH